MRKILIALMLSMVSIVCFGQFNFEGQKKDNLEKVCGIYFNEAIYLNLDDSTFLYTIPGNYYLYDFGIDKTAPVYTFRLIFKTKQELVDFISTLKQIYDNNSDYRGEKISFQNNGETYRIYAPTTKMAVPYITLSNFVWLNGRQYRGNQAGYVLAYIQSPMFIKKINKSLSKY